jgi:hypothetical protein
VLEDRRVPVDITSSAGAQRQGSASSTLIVIPRQDTSDFGAIMKRLSMAVCAAIFAAACNQASPVGPTAFSAVSGGTTNLGSGNPHWILAETGCDTNALECWFKIAGLGVNTGVTVTMEAEVSVTYSCQNPGGVIPGPFQHLQTSTSASASTWSDHNGQITGTLSLDAATPPAAADVCPAANWTVVNVSVASAGPITLSATGLADLTF